MVDRTQAGIAAVRQHMMRLKLGQLPHVPRHLLWGVAAAAALVCAVVSGLSDAGARRTAIVVSSLNLLSAGQAQPSQFNADAATRRLAMTVQALADDRDRLTARLDAIEQRMEDMTGSISRQIEAAKTSSAPEAQQRQPWPSQAPPVPQMPASIATVAVKTVEPVAPVEPVTPPAQAPATSAAPAAPAQYGADVGSALSIKTLHSRWAGIRAAHPDLFAGLHPAVTLRENPQSNQPELRLVVGPFSSADRAGQLCAALAAFHQFCQPTMFDHEVALQ